MNDELKEAENINFPDEEQFGQFMSQYRQLMLLYESAVQCVTVRLDTIGKEVTIREQRSPIRTVTNRIKEPHSIYQKLQKRGYPLTLDSITETSLDKGTQRKTTENELPSLTQCTA